MKKITAVKASWWILLLTGIFLISLSFAFRFVREELDRVNRLSASRQQLVNMGLESRNQLEQLAIQVEGQITEPKVLFSEWAGKEMLYFSDRFTEDLPEGYRHHQVTLSLKNFPADGLSPVIHLAENAIPAWRVTSVNLVSSAGRLQGELLLEALDKSPPEL